MEIKRTELLEALKLCMPGIQSGTPIIEGTDTVAIYNKTMFSYNDSILVAVPVDFDINGSVKGNEFFTILNKLKGEDISITATETSWLMKCGRSKIEMALQAFDYKSRFEQFIGDGLPETWNALPDDFIDALGTVKMSANKTKLAGIYVNDKYMVSTDGQQIHKYMIDGLEPVWLSDNTASEIIKMSDLKEYQLNNNWVYFRNDKNVIFAVKTLNIDSYPISKVIGVLDNHKKSEGDFTAQFPKELLNTIDRAVSFAFTVSEHVAVKLELSTAFINVLGECAAGKFQERVLWDTEIVEFEPITLFVDTEMLNYAGKRSLSFYLHGVDGKKRIVFETEKSIHIMSTLEIR